MNPEENRSQPIFDSEQSMMQWLINMIAESKRISPEQINPEIPFVELGLDSMSAVSLAGDLEMALNLDLSPTLFWEYPNISALVSHIWHVWRENQNTGKP